MPVHAVAHLNIRADATLLARLQDFYTEVLGLRVGWRPAFASHGFWLYADDQPIVHLVQDEAYTAASAGRAGTLDHVALTCSGLAHFERVLESRGWPVRRSGVPGTPLVQLFLKDPAGNGIELQFADGEA